MRVWLLSVALWLLLITPIQSAVPVETLDRFLSQQVERHNLTGLVVVIVDREGVVYQAGFGDVKPLQEIDGVTLDSLMQFVGFDKVALTDKNTIQKKKLKLFI